MVCEYRSTSREGVADSPGMSTNLARRDVPGNEAKYNSDSAFVIGSSRIRIISAELQ